MVKLSLPREIDGGTETVALQLPAVVTADLRLNDPRFVKLPNLMQARKKPIENLSASDLVTELTPRLSLINVAEPPQRKAGIKVDSVDALLQQLRTKEGIAL